MKNNTKSVKMSLRKISSLPCDFFGLKLSVGDLVAPARLGVIRSDIDHVVVGLHGCYIILRPSLSSIPYTRHYLASDFVKLI